MAKGFEPHKYTPKKRKLMYELFKAKHTPFAIAKACKFKGDTKKNFMDHWISDMLPYLVKTEENPPCKVGHKPKGWRKLKIETWIYKDIMLYASVGRNQVEIAKLCGIGPDTLKRYMREDPKLKDAIEFGYARNIAAVEKAMTDLSKGKCTIPRTRYFAHKGKVISERTETIHALPNPQAGTLVLVNKAGWKSGSTGSGGGEQDKGKILGFINSMLTDDTDVEQDS